jgi:hypothetical protein
LSSFIDLPPVKPSAIALGTLFNHGVELAGKSSSHEPLRKLRHGLQTWRQTQTQGQAHPANKHSQS